MTLEPTTASDISQYKGLWCFAEVRHGKLTPTIFELISAARKAAAVVQEPISAVLAGKGVSAMAQELIDAGADQVYVMDNALFESVVDETYAQALRDLVNKEKPAKFLFPATTLGRSIAARLAVLLQTGLMADATELSVDPQTKSLQATRPYFSGTFMGVVACEKRRPELVTVRPMCFPRAEKQSGRQGKIVNADLNPSGWTQKTKFVRFEEDKSGVKDIGGAEVIVSGGRGVGGAEGFKPLEELAQLLGAAVGASRAAVDAGWIPYRHQVGLTGRTVRPKLYIAAGISGQIQHLAGMNSSDVIVCLNKDPEAPLMKMATISVVGDLFELIPAITAEIKKRRG